MRVESPIEQMMVDALISSASSMNMLKDLTIEPQAKIGAYRVDFLVKCDGFLPLVIECDGHDFHERTKEQAARDKARDRSIQSLGHRVFRFTGSEIVRDPTYCATEVLCLFFDDLWEAEKA